MFTKKLARGATTSSVNGSLRQKSKVSFGKVKHLGDEADLSFKVFASNPGQYKNINTSLDEKLGHKIGKNLGYSANSKSDGLLNSCTNTPKAKCFNSGTVKVSSLSLCNFGSIVDDVDMNLLPLVPLESPFFPVVSVKERLCFKLTKSFALNIGLLAVSGNWKIIIKEIPVNLLKSAIESALVKYGKIFSIKMQLIGLWQKVLVEFESFQVANLVVSKWLILLDKDSRYFVLIYAKKQAPMSCPVSFGGVTWASVKSGSPKHLYSTPLIKNNSSIGSVDSLILAVIILASHVSVFKHSLENVSDQMANISHKLDRLLAVLSASFTVLPTPKHNPVLDMTVNALLFVFPVFSVVTAVSQNIFPSGFCVLTVKIGGLKANLAVLENSVKNNDISIVTETKLYFSVKSWIANKFPGVKIFTLGLDAKFLGAGITLIMNKNLAKHVSKISEILDRLLMVCLLFKNKQFVSVLDLYVKTSLDKCIIQADLINSFIARACNKSTFVILGGDFNENGNKRSSSFSKCMDLSLVNALNSRGVERTIDYIFVLQSLSNALVNRHIVDMDEFFSTDHSSVQITIGLGGILDPVLRAICVQANKNNIVRKAICFLVNEVFLKTWSKNFNGGFTKCFSHYHRLKLLVSKLVKTLCSVLSNKFVFLLDVWVSLDSVNASAINFFFLLRSHFDAIRSALTKVRKSYYSLKMIELLVIDKRMKNFELNKGQTIRSVLEQPFCKVILNHLIVNENLILEFGLVKFHVDKIMEGWTRKHVVVDDVSDKWHCQFQLLEYVFDDAFSNKHCDKLVLDSLLVLLNFCLICESILFDKISVACSKYDVFCGDNFLILKGMTIQSPIFAIGSVIEDALEKNCELWLVSQDMRKAYNLVGWKYLKRSLVRIKMCSRFIRFFGSIYNNHMNRIMTNFGLTNSYSIKRQEAVCSYKLNLHYVAKTGHINPQDSLTFFLAADVFMATQHILNVVSEFFRMNDISINNNKTVVIPINCKVVASFLSVNNASISITKKESSLTKVHLDVQFFANLVLRKAISDKQFFYLVLAVFYPIVDYRTQFSFVSVSVCQKWDVLIRKNLKLKLGLLLDFSNNVLYHSSFYGLKTFEQIQAKDKIAAVVCFTNSVEILGQLFMHRSHDLQAWFGSFLVLVYFWAILCVMLFTSGVEFLYLVSLVSQCISDVFPFFVIMELLLLSSFSAGMVLSLTGRLSSGDRDLIYMVLFLSDLLLLFGISMILVFLILGSVDMKAGATAFFEDINLGLGVKVTGMVSFTLVELQAIVLALKCVPNLSSVHLFFDSQAALDVYKAKLLLLALDFWNKCWVEH
ncbi:hypothetical protein G9A89_018913 [Geosiphon pyriformis]|nr:hypothetical protein G9A89_018913 [Geosiphon pyriformis]